MKLQKALASLILISQLNINPASGSEIIKKAPEAPCRLQISIAHLSTNLKERLGIRAVKVDASSICNVPQSDVSITVEIWKTGKFQDYQVWKKTTFSPGATQPGNRVNNFSTYKYCKNKVKTSYYGVAYSKAFIAGKWQYARHVLSVAIIPLKCGT